MDMALLAAASSGDYGLDGFVIILATSLLIS
jgi:hypothetical protein